MFGNILVDKLRFSLLRNSEFNPYKAKEKLDNIMSRHFREKNYTVNFDKRYFRLTFTPTLYLDNVEEYEDKPILNLEMIEEERFFLLLQDIYSVLGDNAVVTWIDIAKNIPTSMNELEYIQAMSKRRFKYPYKIDTPVSQVVVKTLVLSPQKRSNGIDCRNKNRQISLYGKIHEIAKKTKGKTRFVDDVKLTAEELAQIPEANYQKETGRLFLKDLNMVRCEQRYKYTINIKRITQHLTGSSETDKLTLPILLELLKRGELYQKLDEFYTQELTQYVFYNEVEEEPDLKLSKNEEIIKDFILKYGIDTNSIMLWFGGTELENSLKYSMKKLRPYLIDNYYKELYKKLGI